MVNTNGIRRGTRYLFARKFRHSGVEPISTFLKVYRRGDIVDIKGNGAFQRGMPFKYYHGKTGKVFNVTPHAVGVIVNKRVRTQIVPKRINVRVEHVKHSKCRQDFLDRVKANKEKKLEAKKKGVLISCKRLQKAPLLSHFVSTKDNEPQYLEPIPYEFLA